MKIWIERSTISDGIEFSLGFNWEDRLIRQYRLSVGLLHWCWDLKIRFGNEEADGR